MTVQKPAKAAALLLAVVVTAVLPLPLTAGATVRNRYAPSRSHQHSATIDVTERPVGVVSRDLFGANLFWADDAEGSFDLEKDAFYPQFVAAVRRIGITALRYPGGTTSDSFDWERAIGPQAERRPNEPYGMLFYELAPDTCCVLDGPQPSRVGPDEFGRLLQEVGAAGTVTVNFSTGSPTEAADFVAYMTAPTSRRPSRSPAQPSYWAALRAKDGHPAPYDVPYWEVGNEQDNTSQYGWRSGRLVGIGMGKRCPKSIVPQCLYAFGGTTAFTHEALGLFADDLRRASVSNGKADQTMFAYFPPVVPKSQAVYVGSREWHAVSSLSTAGPRAQVYAFNPASGEVVFGDGSHGAVPPAGKLVTISYRSGPHGGFAQYYAAMKRMNPKIEVCEAEERNLAFLQLMGTGYPYGCIEVHMYAKPTDTRAPLDVYAESLLSYPPKEAVALAMLRAAALRYSGRDVPLLVSEYGQLIVPEPKVALHFNLSLDEGLFVATQLLEWVKLGIPVAEKYLLDGIPILPDRQLAVSVVKGGLSVDNAIIASSSRRFMIEPDGLAIELMRKLAGAEQLPCGVAGAPVMRPTASDVVPVLRCVAGLSDGRLVLAVVDGSPGVPVRANIGLAGHRFAGDAMATVLDGPAPGAINTSADPDAVSLRTRSVKVRNPALSWEFPPHSVTVLEVGLSGSRTTRG